MPVNKTKYVIEIFTFEGTRYVAAMISPSKARLTPDIEKAKKGTKQEMIGRASMLRRQGGISTATACSIPVKS